ncbi:aquaporin Z [Clostridiales Family XIII bacterium PM5-7]
MRKYIAEFIGTAVLVTFGCGSAVAANALFGAMGMGYPLAFTTLLIAFAFGLTIVAMAYSVGNISGCHINPAVSIAMLISKRMSGKDFIGYVVAQFLGGIAGAGLLSVIVNGRTSLGTNGYDSLSTFGVSMWIAFLIEVVLTFVFVMAVLGVTEKAENSSVAGLVIGLSLTLVHIFGVPFTGTSVNPARSFGPALLQGGESLTQVWVFIAAPLVGAAIAALVYMFLRQEPKEEVEVVVETIEVVEEIETEGTEEV